MPEGQPETQPEVPVAPVPATEVIVAASSRTSKAKTTLNLQGIFKNAPVPDKNGPPVVTSVNESVLAADLQLAWDAYAEQRKGQAAEYQVLKREFQFNPPVVSILLTNPVEEALLDNFRREFVQYLRDKLKNNEITIVTSIQDNGGKKVIYTNKEKFEHLAGKNPYLNELRDRLGLDWDY